MQAEGRSVTAGMEIATKSGTKIVETSHLTFLLENLGSSALRSVSEVFTATLHTCMALDRDLRQADDATPPPPHLPPPPKKKHADTFD